MHTIDLFLNSQFLGENSLELRIVCICYAGLKIGEVCKFIASINGVIYLRNFVGKFE